MNNIHADGQAEDMIRAIQQLGCAELHAKTLYEKYVSELEEGIVNVDDKTVVQKQLDKIEWAVEQVNSLAETRRKVMLKLYEMYDGDKSVWCEIKHLATAAYTLFEAYQSSEDDRDLLDAATDANKAFLSALSVFLGVEIVSCASCFSEMIREK